MKVRQNLGTLAVVFALALLCAGVSGLAQDKTRKPATEGERREVEVIVAGPEGGPMVHFEKHLPPPGGPHIRGGGGPEDTFVFLSHEMSFGGKVVKGAPYSAEAVTETTHALADGNRIVRKNSAQIYRDGAGRTRRDQTISSIGPFASASDPPQTSFINDPVSGVNYVLDPRSRTARKFTIQLRGEGKPGGGDVFIRKGGPPPPQDESSLPSKERIEREEVRVRVGGGGGAEMMPPLPPPGAAVIAGVGADTYQYERTPFKPQVEKLENRNVEGVLAEGTRTTVTIPAGAIGNEQPINIVSERWYSPELQVVVMTKHSDPRHGETVYTLKNINRSEPAATLFQVPGDYTVKDAGAPMIHRMKKKSADEK